MTCEVRTCAATDSLHDAARIMWERDCGSVPVVGEKCRSPACSPAAMSAWTRRRAPRRDGTAGGDVSGHRSGTGRLRLSCGATGSALYRWWTWRPPLRHSIAQRSGAGHAESKPSATRLAPGGGDGDADGGVGASPHRRGIGCPQNPEQGGA
ncbi:MAG: hypothetical protein AB7V27_19420 [Candidatus Binatia bacterium]